jgi:hypothetical protein
MEMYITMGVMFFLVFIHAFIDAGEIKKGKVINHKMEFIAFLITILLAALLLNNHEMVWWKWYLFCFITAALFRAGFYDFILNLERGLSMWYVSPDHSSSASWYDDWLYKHDINPNVPNVLFAVLSIAWVFLSKLIF